MPREWAAIVLLGCKAAAQVPPPGSDDTDDTDTSSCDGVVVYEDGDGDGWGLDGSEHEVCAAGPGDASVGGDCADEEPSAHPGAEEVWYDGIDQDCADDDDFDADRDGVQHPADCADTDPTILPGAPDPACDRIDSDCDGSPEQCSADLHTIATAELWGAALGDGAGSGLDFAGDVNGDGFDDLVVGALAVETLEPDSPYGRAYLVHGPPPSGDLESVAAARFFHPNPTLDDFYWGREVARAGDTDGDGFDDVWITDYTNLYLFRGPLDGDIGPEDAVTHLYRTGPGAWAFDEETDIRGGQDATGDGVPDLLIGGERGVHLVPGPFPFGSAGAEDAASLSLVHSGFLESECFTGWGQHAEFAGDTDGDGVAEILGVGYGGGCLGGSPHERAALVAADEEGLVDVANGSGPHAVITDEGLGGFSVGDVVGLGDVDGDGYDDLAVAYAAAVAVVHGPLPETVDPATAGFEIRFGVGSLYGGVDLERTGDIDGDGSVDLLMVGSTADLYDPKVQAWLAWGVPGRVGTLDHTEIDWGADPWDRSRAHAAFRTASYGA